MATPSWLATDARGGVSGALRSTISPAGRQVAPHVRHSADHADARRHSRSEAAVPALPQPQRTQHGHDDDHGADQRQDVRGPPPPPSVITTAHAPSPLPFGFSTGSASRQCSAGGPGRSYRLARRQSRIASSTSARNVSDHAAISSEGVALAHDTLGAGCWVAVASVSPAAPSMGRVTTYALPWGRWTRSPSRWPRRSIRRTVCVLTPRMPAASDTVTCWNVTPCWLMAGAIIGAVARNPSTGAVVPLS